MTTSRGFDLRSVNGGAGPGETAGARHAALLLHAMAPADRAWMLDAMPPDERATLQALLDELASLGIASDPALVAQATMGADHAASSTQQGESARQRAPASDDDMLRALTGERLDAAIRALRGEPAALIANWLRVADWPWREELLHALEPGHRVRVEAALRALPQTPLPAAFRAALVSSVVAGLRQPVSGHPPPTRWHGVGRAIRRFWPAAERRQGSHS